MYECLTKSVRIKLCSSLVYISFGKKKNFVCSLLKYSASHLTSAQEFEPVNRYFTAENPEPQSDLECVVGVHSAAASEMYRVKCTDA